MNVCRVNVYADRAFRDFRLVYGNSVGIIFLLPLISDLHLFDPQFHNVTEILFGSLGLLFRRGVGESFQSWAYIAPDFKLSLLATLSSLRSFCVLKILLHKGRLVHAVLVSFPCNWSDSGILFI